MIYFSPAKINLGLQIIARRDDGFHNLRSLMYPLPLYDIIEICQFPGQHIPIEFSQSGSSTGTEMQDNLCIRAWKLMAKERKLPPVAIHLHKQIPVGAGLGGGSSDASTVLTALNDLTDNPLSPEKLAEQAARLGSDCPFFLQSKPMMMEGRGELLSPVDLSLHSFYLVVLFPEIHIPTAEAYGAVTPSLPELHLKQLLKLPVQRWRDQVVNDFEKSTFEKYPLLLNLKLSLYGAGAVYASMSGSGSSIYGIFKKRPDLPEKLREHLIWEGHL